MAWHLLSDAHQWHAELEAVQLLQSACAAHAVEGVGVRVGVAVGPHVTLERQPCGDP